MRGSYFDDYRKKRFANASVPIVKLSTETNDKDKVCRCLKRPHNCICFKTPVVWHDNNGNENHDWVTPPPSPILLHADKIKSWGVQNDDYVYVIRAADDKRIISKYKKHDYGFPHCHETICLETPDSEYNEYIESIHRTKLPIPYASPMCNVDDCGKIINDKKEFLNTPKKSESWKQTFDSYLYQQHGTYF